MKKLSLKSLSAIMITRRKELGITQQQLADLTGINRAMVSHIESESYVPSIPQLEALGSVLGFEP